MFLLIVGIAYATPPVLYSRPDGLRVVLLPDPHASTVGATMLVGVGEVDDPVGMEGIAHLAEHLWFQSIQGASTVGTRLTALGCSNNAFTWLDHTMFETACPPARLDALLDLELARLTPWSFGEAASDVFAVERSIVTVETASRDQEGAAISRAILGSIYRADHPAAARFTRPSNHLDDVSISDFTTFVAAGYRPEHSVLVLTGAFDPAVVNSRLPAGSGTPPVIPEAPAPPRRTLRPAAHAESAAVLHPEVVFAWDLPWTRAGSVSRSLLARELNVLLYWRFNADPSVTGWYCGDLADSLVSPFGCEVEFEESASVEDRATELRTTLPQLWGASDRRLLRPLLGPIASQHELGADLALEDHSVGPGGYAVNIARSVWLSLDFAPSSTPDVAALLELGATALPPAEASVIALVPDGSAPEPLAAASTRSFPPLSPPAPEPTAGRAASRTLPNGVRLLAVQRADTRLYHTSLRLLPPASGLEVGAVLADSFGYDDPPASLLQDTIAYWGGGREGIEHTTHARTLVTAIETLTARVLHPRFDLSNYTVEATRWARGSAEARGYASWWTDTLTWTALHQEDTNWYTQQTWPSRADVAQVVSDWVRLRLDPAYIQVVVVGPDEPEVLLDSADAAFTEWGIAGGARTLVELQRPAPHAWWISSNEGPLATIMATCPGVDPDAEALGALIASTLQQEERERQGATYGVQAGVSRGVLQVSTMIRSDRIGAWLSLLGAVLGETAPEALVSWRRDPADVSALVLGSVLVARDWDTHPEALIGRRTGPVASNVISDCRDHLQVAVAAPPGSTMLTGPDPATEAPFEATTVAALQAR